MELRHLRYFVVVAEEGHITRAAERLGMQQPPLSQQIKAMERELGEQLFRRKARGVELTNAGHVLLGEARSMLAQLDRALETTRRAARGEQGKLCVGFTSTSPFHPLIPQTIRTFREACPMVSLTIEECMSNELVDRLRGERIDIAFIRTAMAGSDGLVVNQLAEEPMMVALPSTHPAAMKNGGSSVRMRDLAGELFILYGPPGTGMYDAIISACLAAGFNPRVGNLGAATQQAPRITSTLSLVAAGLGITCVPSSLQRMNMEGVVYREIEGPVRPRSSLSIAYRRGDTSSVVRRLVTISRKLAQEHRSKVKS
jgi:DNA-binding transcriptional LysR family regulator